MTSRTARMLSAKTATGLTKHWPATMKRALTPRTLSAAWQRFRRVNFTHRQAAALAIVSGLVFAMLVVAWLVLSTRTALLNERIDRLDTQQTQLMDEVSQTLLEIGEATAPKAMDERARRLGYRSAERIEFLRLSSAVTKPESTDLFATGAPGTGVTITGAITSTTVVTR